MINNGRNLLLIMPYVTNDGIRIHYTTEGEPDNPPLLLLHWFMGSHKTWYDVGWVRELSDRFYLILVDHRGYGMSDKPHEPEDYKAEHHASDMVQLLDELGIEQTHIMGYSMGARIGYAMLAHTPDRVKTAILGGMHPYSSDQIPTDLDQRIELLKQGMEITLKTYGIGPQPVFERMLENDAKALLADTIQTKSWQGLQDEVKSFDRPVLLFVGKDDGFYEGMRRIDNELSNSHFVAFTGENHRTAFLKRQLLLPHLKRFLNF